MLLFMDAVDFNHSDTTDYAMRTVLGSCSMITDLKDVTTKNATTH